MNGADAKAWRLDAEKFVVRDLEDESIVLDLRSGDYYTLDGAGACALRLFVEGHPFAAVVDVLIERYDAPDRECVEEDVRELAREFEKKGILRSDG